MNILHLQIPLRPGTRLSKQDNFAIKPETLGEFMKYLQKGLGENYQVIASPCIPSLLSDSDIVYNFDMKGISLAELNEMIKNV